MSVTNKKGDIGELAVATELVRLGYNVSIPFGHDVAYDLVVEVDGALKKVQIKTTQQKNGVLVARCKRVTNITCGKQVRTTYTSDDLDYLIVYDIDTQQCYNIPLDLVDETEDSLNLRVEPTKNNQRKKIRWARDYLLEGL